jgi:hypothetical protein
MMVVAYHPERVLHGVSLQDRHSDDLGRRRRDAAAGHIFRITEGTAGVDQRRAESVKPLCPELYAGPGLLGYGRREAFRDLLWGAVQHDETCHFVVSLPGHD